MSPPFATSTVSSIMVRCQLGEYLKAIDRPSRSAIAPAEGARPLSIEIRSGASYLVALSISLALIPRMISATWDLILASIGETGSAWAVAHAAHVAIAIETNVALNIQ